MTHCDRCGTEVPEGARFCPACGQPVAAAATAPAPSPPTAPAGPAGQPAAALPAWLTADWLVAAIAAGVVLAACLAVGVVYGAVLAVAATGEAGAVVSGIVTGAYLPFVMFGVETAAARLDGDTLVVVAARYLPLLLLAVPVAATWLALRFALPRSRADQAGRLALVAKLALVVCATLAVMAGLVSIGDADRVGREGFVADVSAGAAAVYPLLVVVPTGLVFLARAGALAWTPAARRLAGRRGTRSAAWGAGAFVALAAGMGVLALVADVITADGGPARATEVVRVPLDGLNEGVAGAVVAMGGAVARLGSHTSLLHWGSYDAPGTGNAPAPLFLLLVAAPAVVAMATTRRLDREQPAGEQAVLEVAAAVAAGFVAAAWLGSLLGRIERFTGDPVVQPSPRGAFGLSLLWAAVGAGGAAVVWARRRGLRWAQLTPPAPAAPPPAPAAPPPAPPAEGEATASVEATAVLPLGSAEPAEAAGPAARRRRRCAACGAALDRGAAFCPACGAPAAARRRRPPDLGG